MSERSPTTEFGSLPVVRDQEIRMTFRSDDATAAVIKDAMEKAAVAMYAPTTESAGALFELAAERVCVAARLEREAA